MTKILLVEDDKSLREIYGVRLLAEGYDIVSAGDGEEALAMAIKEKPLLIISDVMMPKISGFDMLDILRSTTETRDIKVIMMTALSSDDQRSRGEQLGADRYLVKSQVGIEDVVRTVHEVLSDGPIGAAVATAGAVAATPAAPDEPTALTPAISTPPVGPEESSAAPVANDTTPVSSSPGNEDAGPLPPQPTESTLPQPLAPFSSPRPTNLGEQAVQPAAEPASSAPLPEEEVFSSESIAQELQASAEPVVNSQVDEAISDNDIITEQPAATSVEPQYIATPETPVVAEETDQAAPAAPAPEDTEQDDNRPAPTPPTVG